MRQVSCPFAVSAMAMVLCGCGGPAYDAEILNVSYDPTRALYKEMNKAFAAHYQEQTGKRVRAVTTHAGSGAQARAVIDGQPADVVTLALAGDIDRIAKSGLMPIDWQRRLPENSSPYKSAIVFLVRPGNPKTIKDWADLVRADVEVVTPNPKTSGGARWNFLAAWGYQTVHLRKTETEATEFMRRLYANVKKLDTGARGASETFARRKEGDVLISWENEAILLKNEAKGELEIVYPSVTILAEPPVTLVDENVDARGTREVAEAYLKFLYSDEGQEIVGRHGYRPINEKFDTLPKVKTLTFEQVAGDWPRAHAAFFSDGGVFDRIRAK